MSKPVIEVEHISKRYRIGAKENINKTLRESLTGLATSPWRNLKRLWNLTHFESQSEEDIIWALKDISFTVNQGDVVGIIGKNGSGKSTLLKILSRITDPTEGKAILRGRIGSLLEVGTGFHPEMTGRENIYMSGTIMGMRKWEIDKNLDEIIDFSGIEKFIDTPVKRYSSGMYVRLAFAVAAHLQPEILLIDEVLAVGDVEFQKKCLGKMGDISKEGRTVLFVSHNMAAVGNLCTKGVLLHEGIITFCGEIDKAVSIYINQSYKSNEDSTEKFVVAENEKLGIRFLGVSFHNSKGEESLALVCGTKCSIRLHIESKRKYQFLLSSIGVTNIQGIDIGILHSKISGFSGGLTSSTSYLECVLPKLTLLPGIYYLNIKIVVDDEVAFYITQNIKLTVEKGDFFGTGLLPDSAWSGLNLIDNYWRYYDQEEKDIA